MNRKQSVRFHPGCVMTNKVLNRWHEADFGSQEVVHMALYGTRDAGHILKPTVTEAGCVQGSSACACATRKCMAPSSSIKVTTM